MSRIKLLIYSSFLAVLVPTSAQAQGIPVYDASSFTQFVTQLQQMSEDYQKQLEQLDEAIKQTNSITGTRNMGSLANDALAANLRRYLPTSWEDTMNMINASGLPDGALGTQSLYNDLYTTYGPVSGADFMATDPTGPIAQAVDRKTNTTFAAMAASEQAYNNIAGRIETYEALLNELNNTTDLKSSTDLQARISAENGMILNELVRLQAIQMQQQAAKDSEELTTYRHADSANKYDAAKAAEAFQIEE